MADMETITYGGGPLPGRKGRVSLPRAELRFAPAEDGRWMWAVSYQSAGGFGFGSTPLPKWGRFAADRAAAVAAAVADLREQLQRAAERPPSALIAWLDSLSQRPQPSQLELFSLEIPGETA